MTSLAAAVRFVHLAGLALLAGAFVFNRFVSRPALRNTGRSLWPELESFDRLELGLIKWSLLVALLSGLVGFWIQAVSVTGRSLAEILTAAAIGEVLVGTQFGTVWLIRSALMLLLAARLRLLREKNRSSPLPLSGLALSIAIVAALVLAGHAAAGEGTKLLIQLLADSLHLLAANFWLGGLVSFALFLVWVRRINEPWGKEIGKEATRRFSLLGLASVGILTVTGIFNAWNLVGAVPPLVGTTYGKLLLVKLALLLPLIAVAAVNLLDVKPGILSLTARNSIEQTKNLFLRLKRNVVAEACLGACVLIIVGAMSVTPPARHIQPSWPFSFRWNWNAVSTSPKIRSQVTVGKWLAAAGLVALCCALIRRRQHPWLAGAGLTGLAYGGLVAFPALSIDAYPTTYTRPSVPYQAISVVSGLRLYQDSCAACHGVSGYGDGPSGQGLKPKPADLTSKHTGDHTAGDLFWWLNHGKTETAMPGFQQSLSEEEVWDSINFIRTVSAAEQARSMSPLAEPNPWLVAPDFVYRTAKIEGEALRDHRGRNIILLVLFTTPQSQKRLEELDQAYEKLRSLGVEILAAPREQERTLPQMRQSVRLSPIVTDGSHEIFQTYALFRRSFSADGTLPDPPIPAHMEFLIDRQGYVRARWIQGEDVGWSKVENLLREIDRLNREKPSKPAPDDHVH